MINIINDLDDAMQVVNPKTVLKIYKAPSGQWSGIFYQNDEEIGRIAGCQTYQEVEEEAFEQGFADLFIIYPLT
ncbi:hypothetical protein [Duganella sp. Leaf61]|uniref:hypothetical protein n=1 Tax=Duganella sp. Leaf61 TaxID=1736227 RepID=UPI0012E129BC|nr:hypothetical protein [Duganella sp. Leaf61]